MSLIGQVEPGTRTRRAERRAGERGEGDDATGARLSVAVPRDGPQEGAGGLATPYSPECVEGEFSEVRRSKRPT